LDVAFFHKYFSFHAFAYVDLFIERKAKKEKRWRGGTKARYEHMARWMDGHTYICIHME
jgi:hypothetical protein